MNCGNADSSSSSCLRRHHHRRCCLKNHYCCCDHTNHITDTTSTNNNNNNNNIGSSSRRSRNNTHFGYDDYSCYYRRLLLWMQLSFFFLLLLACSSISSRFVRIIRIPSVTAAFSSSSSSSLHHLQQHHHRRNRVVIPSSPTTTTSTLLCLRNNNNNKNNNNPAIIYQSSLSLSSSRSALFRSSSTTNNKYRNCKREQQQLQPFKSSSFSSSTQLYMYTGDDPYSEQFFTNLKSLYTNDFTSLSSVIEDVVKVGISFVPAVLSITAQLLYDVLDSTMSTVSQSSLVLYDTIVSSISQLVSFISSSASNTAISIYDNTISSFKQIISDLQSYGSETSITYYENTKSQLLNLISDLATTTASGTSYTLSSIVQSLNDLIKSIGERTNDIYENNIVSSSTYELLTSSPSLTATTTTTTIQQTMSNTLISIFDTLSDLIDSSSSSSTSSTSSLSSENFISSLSQLTSDITESLTQLLSDLTTTASSSISGSSNSNGILLTSLSSKLSYDAMVYGTAGIMIAIASISSSLFIVSAMQNYQIKNKVRDDMESSLSRLRGQIIDQTSKANTLFSIAAVTGALAVGGGILSSGSTIPGNNNQVVESSTIKPTVVLQVQSQTTEQQQRRQEQTTASTERSIFTPLLMEKEGEDIITKKDKMEAIYKTDNIMTAAQIKEDWEKEKMAILQSKPVVTPIIPSNTLATSSTTDSVPKTDSIPLLSITTATAGSTTSSSNIAESSPLSDEIKPKQQFLSVKDIVQDLRTKEASTSSLNEGSYKIDSAPSESSIAADTETTIKPMITSSSTVTAKPEPYESSSSSSLSFSERKAPSASNTADAVIEVTTKISSESSLNDNERRQETKMIGISPGTKLATPESTSSSSMSSSSPFDLDAVATTTEVKPPLNDNIIVQNNDDGYQKEEAAVLSDKVAQPLMTVSNDDQAADGNTADNEKKNDNDKTNIESSEQENEHLMPPVKDAVLSAPSQTAATVSPPLSVTSAVITEKIGTTGSPGHIGMIDDIKNSVKGQEWKVSKIAFTDEEVDEMTSVAFLAAGVAGAVAVTQRDANSNKSSFSGSWISERFFGALEGNKPPMAPTDFREIQLPFIRSSVTSNQKQEQKQTKQRPVDKYLFRFSQTTGTTESLLNEREISQSGSVSAWPSANVAFQGGTNSQQQRTQYSRSNGGNNFGSRIDDSNWFATTSTENMNNVNDENFGTGVSANEGPNFDRSRRNSKPVREITGALTIFDQTRNFDQTDPFAAWTKEDNRNDPFASRGQEASQNDPFANWGQTSQNDPFASSADESRFVNWGQDSPNDRFDAWGKDISGILRDSNANIKDSNFNDSTKMNVVSFSKKVEDSNTKLETIFPIFIDNNVYKVVQDVNKEYPRDQTSVQDTFGFINSVDEAMRSDMFLGRQQPGEPIYGIRVARNTLQRRIRRKIKNQRQRKYLAVNIVENQEMEPRMSTSMYLSNGLYGDRPFPDLGQDNQNDPFGNWAQESQYDPLFANRGQGYQDSLLANWEQGILNNRFDDWGEDISGIITYDKNEKTEEKMKAQESSAAEELIDFSNLSDNFATSLETAFPASFLTYDDENNSKRTFLSTNDDDEIMQRLDVQTSDAELFRQAELDIEFNDWDTEEIDDAGTELEFAKIMEEITGLLDEDLVDSDGVAPDEALLLSFNETTDPNPVSTKEQNENENMKKSEDSLPSMKISNRSGNEYATKSELPQPVSISKPVVVPTTSAPSNDEEISKKSDNIQVTNELPPSLFISEPRNGGIAVPTSSTSSKDAEISNSPDTVRITKVLPTPLSTSEPTNADGIVPAKSVSSDNKEIGSKSDAKSVTEILPTALTISEPDNDDCIVEEIGSKSDNHGITKVSFPQLSISEPRNDDVVVLVSPASDDTDEIRNRSNEHGVTVASPPPLSIAEASNGDSVVRTNTASTIDEQLDIKSNINGQTEVSTSILSTSDSRHGDISIPENPSSGKTVSNESDNDGVLTASSLLLSMSEPRNGDFGFPPSPSSISTGETMSKFDNNGITTVSPSSLSIADPGSGDISVSSTSALIANELLITRNLGVGSKGNKFDSMNTALTIPGDLTEVIVSVGNGCVFLKGEVSDSIHNDDPKSSSKFTTVPLKKVKKKKKKVTRIKWNQTDGRPRNSVSPTGSYLDNLSPE